MPASRPDQGDNLLISLTFIRLRHQARRWRKALAVGLRQLVGTCHEALQAAVVLVDILHHATTPGREADAEDGADVGVAD